MHIMMLLNMSSTSGLKDIFVWPDGYWCFREDFHEQPRQNYSYVLVEINDTQWDALRAGAPLSSVAVARQPGDSNTKH